jgi:hypothetical protein
MNQMLESDANEHEFELFQNFTDNLHYENVCPHDNLSETIDEYHDIIESINNELNVNVNYDTNDLDHANCLDNEEIIQKTPFDELKTRLFQRIGVTFYPCTICTCNNFAGRPYSGEACLNCGHFREKHF